MALVTDYSSLQTHVADVLNRTDLTSVIPNFIEQFEARAKDESRLRKLVDRGTVSISADGTALPSDLYSVEAWYHDGGTYYGPITVVGADQIGSLKATYGDSGVPQFAAIVNGSARFAPEPDSTYSTKMTYWQGVTNLSAANTTNWLLTSRPDIYLQGTLVEAWDYLRDEARADRAEAKLERLLEGHHLAAVDGQFGGNIGGRQFRPIGG